jgi:hypothetical protein
MWSSRAIARGSPRTTRVVSAGSTIQGAGDADQHQHQQAGQREYRHRP